MASFFTDNLLLLAPLVEPSTEGNFKFSPSKNLDRLKQYVLYFPQIVLVPYCSRFVGLNLVSEEYQTLVDQHQVGIVGPRTLSVPKFSPEFFENDYRSVFEGLNTTPGNPRFSASVPITDAAEAGHANSYSCLIADALPAPKSDATISDILALRAEKAEELQKFGRYINRLVASFGNGNASRRDCELVVEELEDRLGQIDHILSGSGLIGQKLSLKVSNFISTALIPGLAELIASKIHLAPGLAAGGAGVLQLMLTRSSVGDFGNAYPRDFEYILSAHDQGIIGGKPESADDYLHFALNDQDNVFTFVMPPVGTPLSVPFRPSFSMSNCVDA